MKKVSLKILLFMVFALALSACLPEGDTCQKIEVQTRIEVYTESDHATNYIADLQPGDVLYICGE
jgi:hypothetical protein